MIYEVCLIHKVPGNEELIHGPVAVCAPDEQLAIQYVLGNMRGLDKYNMKEVDVVVRPFTTVRPQNVILNPSAKHAAERQETLRIWRMTRPDTTTYTVDAILNP